MNWPYSQMDIYSVWLKIWRLMVKKTLESNSLIFCSKVSKYGRLNGHIWISNIEKISFQLEFGHRRFSSDCSIRYPSEVFYQTIEFSLRSWISEWIKNLAVTYFLQKMWWRLGVNFTFSHFNLTAVISLSLYYRPIDIIASWKFNSKNNDCFQRPRSILN